MLLLVSLLACNPQDTDTDTDVVVQDTEEQGCNTLEIRHDGPDEPHVNDQWTVWLYCDDALMTGAQVTQLDPADFAQISDNVITFTQAGTATLKVQVGVFRTTEDVTVLE